MADPTQFSGVGGGYVDHKWSVFILKETTERKDFSLFIFLRSFCLDLGTITKTTGIGIFITPENSRQRVTAIGQF
jgi:hypothetical protein